MGQLFALRLDAPMRFSGLAQWRGYRWLLSLSLSLGLAACGQSDLLPPTAGSPNAESHSAATGSTSLTGVTSSTGAINSTSATTPELASTTNTFEAEVALARSYLAQQSLPALGFYDVTENGSARILGNDLPDADLKGEVQFAQSHTIDASGNTAKNMPSLVINRAALLLFFPLSSYSGGLNVKVIKDGNTIFTSALVAPAFVPRSDYSATDARPDVAYSRQAWAVELPATAVQPGISLTFFDGSGQTGLLPASNIEMSPPTELVLQSIRLGMLTAAPVSSEHYLLESPAVAGTDYFQTIPVSKLVVAQYQTAKLEKVIVASGVIHDTVSTTTGDVYSGDMRENVAKAQVSTGINLANMGISTSWMDQINPHYLNQIVMHHARGKYTNGDVSHGLSGGNGIGTLYASMGNELSHELGHAFSLGHYPGMTVPPAGADTETVNRLVKNAIHHADSGWGYMAHLKRMRANFYWKNAHDATGTGVNGQTYSKSFAGLYNFNRDAMSGGEVASNWSSYTHHTGYSAKIIQDALAHKSSGSTKTPRLVPDVTYPSGWRAWDSSKNQFADAKLMGLTTPAKPLKVGVPVVTLLGGYNPANPVQNLMYPAFYGNYGNVFSPQAPDKNNNACWIALMYADRSFEEFALTGQAGLKQLNINLDAARTPQRAELICQYGRVRGLFKPEVLTAIDIAPYPQSLPAPTLIGQEYGVSALQKVMTAELNTALTADSVKAGELPSNLKGNLELWRDRLPDLSPAAKRIANEYYAISDKQVVVSAWLARNKSALTSPTNNLRTQLEAMLLEYGFIANQIKVEGGLIKAANGACVTLEFNNGNPQLTMTAGANCQLTNAAHRWWLDQRGLIRSATRPDLCFATTGGLSELISIQECNSESRGQKWVQYLPTGVAANKIFIQSKDYSNRCLDSNGPGPVIYDCELSPNRTWSAPIRSTDILWSSFSDADLKLILAAN